MIYLSTVYLSTIYLSTINLSTINDLDPESALQHGRANNCPS